MSDAGEKDRNEPSGPRGSTTPTFTDLDTRHMVFEIQGTIGNLVGKVETLLQGRDVERAERRQDAEAIKDEFRRGNQSLKDDVLREIDGAKTDNRREFTEAKERFDGFVKDKFDPLDEKVTNLRLQWAKVAGIAFAVSAGLSLVWTIVKYGASKGWFQ